MTAQNSDRKNILDELDEIRDLATCAAMSTHAFDSDTPDEAVALRTFCNSIARRLGDITQGRSPFTLPQSRHAG